MNRPLLSPLRILPEIKPALNLFSDEAANDLGNKIAATLSYQKPHNSNLTKNDLYPLKHLRNDKTIVITRADKSNTKKSNTHTL